MDDLIVIAIGLSILGYLVGSISFARLIHFLVKKDKSFTPFRQRIPHSEKYFESDLVSATTVSVNLGKRYGCLVSLLDLIKVALPTILVKHFFPGDPWFLLVAVAGIGGHVYPLFHRFRGGRGESSMLGAFLVINWFGIGVTNGASLVLGYFFGSVLVWRFGWYILTIFWYAWYFQDPWYVCFALVANAFFWLSMRNDLKKFRALKQKGRIKFTEADISEFIMMGKTPGRFLDKYGLPALIRKLTLHMKRQRK